MTTFAAAMSALGIIAGYAALFFYFRSVDALEEQRRRQARAEEFAQAQRRISHRGRA